MISTKDFSKEDFNSLFDYADEVERSPAKYRDVLKDKRVALLFLEPSTRTYGSFHASAENLGCKILSNRSSSLTSLVKGETLHDTIKMIESYDTDCIVIRDKHMGSARFAAEITETPIINAGSGSQEHPTQAMLDLYTILKKRGKIDDVKIGFIGDLKYGRTCSSLSYALANYDNVELIFIAPPLLQVRQEVEIFLQENKVSYLKTEDFKEVIDQLDVLYVTRIQRERFPDPTEYERIRGSYIIDLNSLTRAKEKLGVMHPLPRVDELSSEVDKTKHAWYFEQAACGIPIRTALLYLILEG